MDRREWIAGKWDDKKRAHVITGRPYWKDLLGVEGIAFVSDLLKRMIEHEAKYNMKPLTLTQEESNKWHKACGMCFDEGWDRFYFDDRGELQCASRIKIDKQHEPPPVKLGPWHPVKKERGPMSETLDGFVREE